MRKLLLTTVLSAALLGACGDDDTTVVIDARPAVDAAGTIDARPIDAAATIDSGGGAATIANIQNGTIPVSTVVTLTNLVVTATTTATPTANIWVCQTATCAPNEGVQLYIPSATSLRPATAPAPGTIITSVTGTVLEYQVVGTDPLTVTEVEVSALTIGAAGAAPTPATVTLAALAAGAEAYEGVLTRVASVKVTNANPDAPSDFGQWQMGPQAAGVERFIVDDRLSGLDQPALDTTYATVTGIVDYGYAIYKIEPRGAGDLVP